MKARIKLREEKNLSRSDIATMINMRYSNYCILERKDLELPLDYLVTIATECNVPFYELIDNPNIKEIAKTIKII